MGELDDAIMCYRTALRLKPDHPHAYNNLGNAMKDKGAVKEAVHCYVTAIRLMPHFAAAHSNLGSVLKEQGKLDQALAHYHQAITIDPMFADAYSNMGNAYKDLGRLEEAIRCYLTAIQIRPNFADAYSNLGSTYKDGGQVVEAIKCYRRALELKPAFPDAFANLVHSLVFICDWSTRTEDFHSLSELIQVQLQTEGQLPSVQPFHALVYPLTLAEMQAIARRYAVRASMNVALIERRFTFARSSGRSRLRIGYVSSDLGNHPLSHLMSSVFGLHTKGKFEVTCYALSPNDHSPWRRKIETEVENFKDISQLQTADAVQMIYSDQIDILINLNGYTKGARNEIFAMHAAPLQVSYMGFCGTLGADYIEYMIADECVVPPELRSHYSEKIVSMPHSYFVNDHKQSARYMLEQTTQLPTRSQYGVPEDKFVFCNFNQIYKVDPTIFSVWMSILKRVPNSVLWLLRFPPVGEANIRAEAAKHGVRDDQILFSDVAPKDEHIQRGFLGDLFLDTPSCNAHTTGCDILWSGTPMLTMVGEKMATRVGASLLRAADVPELVTSSYYEYEELAVTLALDPERLFNLRQRIEQGRTSCALFDTQRWVLNMEKGLKLMWQRYERGLGPDHIQVSDELPIVLGPESGSWISQSQSSSRSRSQLPPVPIPTGTYTL